MRSKLHTQQHCKNAVFVETATPTYIGRSKIIISEDTDRFQSKLSVPKTSKKVDKWVEHDEHLFVDGFA